MKRIFGNLMLGMLMASSTGLSAIGLKDCDPRSWSKETKKTVAIGAAATLAVYIGYKNNIVPEKLSILFGKGVSTATAVADSATGVASDVTIGATAD